MLAATRATSSVRPCTARRTITVAPRTLSTQVRFKNDAEQAADKAARKIDNAANKTKRAGENVADDVQDNAQDALDKGKSGVRSAIDNIKDGAEQLKENVQDAGAGIKDAAQNLVNNAPAIKGDKATEYEDPKNKKHS